MQRERAISGLSHRCQRDSGELARVEPGRSGEVERAHVVVREQLGVVICPSQRLDPARNTTVLVGPLCPWDRRIRRIADERVAERPFGLACNRRLVRAPHQRLPLERTQMLLCRPAIVSAGGCDGARPEHGTRHGRILRNTLLGLGQGVEAGDYQRLNGVGHGLCTSALGDHPHVLLRVQRVPASLLEQRGSGVGRNVRDGEELGDQRRGRVVGERVETHCRHVLHGSPARQTFEQFGSRRSQDEEREVAQPLS